MLAPDPGSFRDPGSRVFTGEGRVVRALSADADEDLAALEASELFAAATSAGELVPTRRLASPPPLVAGDGWAAYLEHGRVPVVSYPYEWSFEMLRDAALLTLSLTERALGEGLVTKDATPFNVQFDGARPVFIDLGSFERLRPGQPWFGYRQFCDTFLDPLLIWARRGVPTAPWLRGSLRGIGPADTSALLRLRDKCSPAVLLHVVLHARLERRYAATERDVRSELAAAGLSPRVLRAQVRGLARAVRRLRWAPGETAWSGYGERGHYGDADLAAKEAFVRRVATRRRRRQVLDLGANDGRFSELVAPHADHVVAVDGDALVVDRLYRRLTRGGPANVLPLVMDLADPSGGLGWRGRERAPFVDRVAPELVLSLALAHHLAITASIPLEEVVASMAEWRGPAGRAEVVFEFPLPEDPKVVTLLDAKRDGRLARYSLDVLEAALDAHFDVAEREALPSGTRLLYHLRPRA